MNGRDGSPCGGVAKRGVRSGAGRKTAGAQARECRNLRRAMEFESKRLPGILGGPQNRLLRNGSIVNFAGRTESKDANVTRILLPNRWSRCRGPKRRIRYRSVGQTEELVKMRADERETVEKPMNRRKKLDKKKGRMIFQFHASVFVLGVLWQK